MKENSMPTMTGKVHDLTHLVYWHVSTRHMPDGSVVVATIFNPGRNNEFGVYVLATSEHDRESLRASCLRKPDALMFAEALVK